MKGKAIYIALVVLGVFCVETFSAGALENTDRDRTALNELRKKMNDIKYVYEGSMQKANTECDNAVSAARGEFHALRSKALEERKEKLSGLKADYENKIGPMEAEEKDLLQKLAPAGNNFAKAKSK